MVLNFKKKKKTGRKIKDGGRNHETTRFNILSLFCISFLFLFLTGAFLDQKIQKADLNTLPTEST